MFSFQRAVSLALLLSLSTGLCAAPRWLKAQSGEVTVLSDLSRSDLTDIAVRYSAFRHTLNELLAPPGRKLPPAILIVFRNYSKMEDLVGKSKGDNVHMTSFTTQVDETAVMAISYDQDRENTLYLCYVFDAMNSIDRLGYFVPLWFEQGTGEVLASINMKKDRCIVGETDGQEYNAWAQGDQVPWTRFFDVSRNSTEYTDSQKGMWYQAQAWAFMHTLLLDKGNFHASFMEAARRAQENPLGPAAAEKALGVSTEKFSAVVNHHMRHDHLATVPFDSVAAAKQIRISEAPEAEVRVRTADILAGTGQPWLVDAELAVAKQLAPNTPLVDEALARRALANSDEDGAVLLYRKAMGEGSSDEVAYLYSAEARLNESAVGGVDHAGDGGTNIPPAIDELHEVLKMNPGNRRAWAMLGRAYFLENKLADSGPDDLAGGLAEDEDGMRLRYVRALLYNRLNRREACVADLKAVIADPIAPENLRSAAVGMRDELRFADDSAQATALEKERDYTAALTLIEAGRAAVDDTAAVARYDQLKKVAIENQASRDLFALYNAKKYAEFKPKAEAFVAKYPGNGNVAALLPMIEQAEDAERPGAAVSGGAGGDAPPVRQISLARLGIAPGKRIFDRHHDYLSEVEKTLEAEWSREEADMTAEASAGPGACTVTIRFRVNSKGEIASIVQTDGSGSPKLKELCEGALRKAAPFKEWSDDMVADLGDEQLLIVRLYYE